MHSILIGDITRVSATYFHSIISTDIYHSSEMEKVCAKGREDFMYSNGNVLGSPEEIGFREK